MQRGVRLTCALPEFEGHPGGSGKPREPEVLVEQRGALSRGVDDEGFRARQARHFERVPDGVLKEGRAKA